MTTTYRYFISYTHQDAYGFGSGNCDISLARPIHTMADVNHVAELLRNNGVQNPVVMSFCRFDEQDSPAQDRNQPGPVDNLTFDYIRQLLQEQARPLTAGQIADMLGYPVDAVRRITQRAVHNHRLVVTDGRYSLPRKEGRR